jgi:hypothetical protein
MEELITKSNGTDEKNRIACYQNLNIGLGIFSNNPAIYV